MKTPRSLLAIALVASATSTAHAQPVPSSPPPTQPVPAQPASSAPPAQPAPPTQTVAASPAQTPPPSLPQPGVAPPPSPMQPGTSSPPPAPYVGPNGYPTPYGPAFVQPNMADEVVVMPPGFLERPGRFPRILAISDRRAPIPVGYHLGREPRKPLWVAGTAIFAASHALTGLTAGGLLADNPDDGEYGLLFLPVIGPVVWAGVTNGLGDEDARTLFAGMSAVTAVQGIGFGLMLAGFSFPRRVHVRNDVASAASSTIADAEGPSLTFSIRPGGVGLAVDF